MSTPARLQRKAALIHVDGHRSAEILFSLRLGDLWRAFWSQGAAFILLCTYVFFEYVRPQSIYPSIDILPWAMMTLLATLVARVASRQPGATSGGWTSLLLLLFFLSAALSTALAYDAGLAYARLEIFLTWGLVYCLVISTVTTERRLFLFLLLYFLWNFKMSQHGARTWAERGFGFAGWGISGSPGWWQNSGEFGAQMAMFFPMALYLFMSIGPQLRLWRKLVIAALPVTAVASVIASNSRGAILAAGGVLAWMLLIRRSDLRVLLLIGVIGYGGYTLIPPESLERFQTAGDDETSVNRLVRWAAGYEIFRDHSVLGIGPDNFVSYYMTKYPREDSQEGWGLSHNSFVDVAAEHGAVGVVTYALLIASTFLLNLKSRARARMVNDLFLRNTAYGLDCAMIAWLISSAFMSVLHYPMFWLHLAMTVALNNVSHRASVEPPKSSTARVER